MDKSDEQALDHIIERDYRRKSQWYSFTSQIWGFLGMATFLGTLTALISGGISLLGKVSGLPTDPIGLAFSNAPVISILALGGLAAFGAVSTWMSQREATELHLIQDENMAYQNAKSMNKARAKSKELENTVLSAPPTTPLNPLVPEPTLAKPAPATIIGPVTEPDAIKRKDTPAPARIDGKKWEDIVKAAKASPELPHRIH